MAGSVGQDLRAGGGTVDISGTVGRNAYIKAKHVHIMSGAVIKGDLSYESPNVAEIDPGAKILGRTEHTVPKAAPAAHGMKFMFWLASLIAAIVFGIVVLSLFPARSQAAASATSGRFWMSLGIGILLLIATPIACRRGDYPCRNSGGFSGASGIPGFLIFGQSFCGPVLWGVAGSREPDVRPNQSGL